MNFRWPFNGHYTYLKDHRLGQLRTICAKLFQNWPSSWWQEDFYMFALSIHRKNWPHPPSGHVFQGIILICAILVDGHPRTICFLCFPYNIYTMEKLTPPPGSHCFSTDLFFLAILVDGHPRTICFCTTFFSNQANSKILPKVFANGI